MNLTPPRSEQVKAGGLCRCTGRRMIAYRSLVATRLPDDCARPMPKRKASGVAPPPSGETIRELRVVTVSTRTGKRLTRSS